MANDEGAKDSEMPAGSAGWFSAKLMRFKIIRPESENFKILHPFYTSRRSEKIYQK